MNMDMNNRSKFCQALNHLLTVSGMNAVGLAMYLDAGVPEVNRWLRGTAAPDVYQFQKIARLFGMPYSYFLDDGNSLPDVPEIAQWLGLQEDTVESLLELADSEPSEVMDALDHAVAALIEAVDIAREVDVE